MVDGAQIQSQAMQNRDNAADPSNIRMQDERGDASTAGDGEDKEEDEKEEEKEDEKDTDEDNEHKSLKKQLADNLHEQSQLTHTIEDLTNEAGSDEEIDALAQQVGNETESAAMGDMLGHMWKDMRMLELPAYSKYVKKKVVQLKHEENELESKLGNEQNKEGGEDEKNKYADEAKEEDDNDEKEEKSKDEKDEQPMGLVVSPSVNFWRMSHNQQESTLMSSLFYVIGGLLAAVLFKQVREKYFVLEPVNKRNDSGHDFSFSIFGCLAEPKLCVLAFCCPCLAWADTMDQNKDKGLLHYWPAFLFFFGLLVLAPYTMGISSLFIVGLGVYYRQKLRQANSSLVHSGEGTDEKHASGKKVTLALDILFWCFCQPCAIIQEAREESVTRSNLLSAGVV